MYDEEQTITPREIVCILCVFVSSPPPPSIDITHSAHYKSPKDVGIFKHEHTVATHACKHAGEVREPFMLWPS